MSDLRSFTTLNKSWDKLAINASSNLASSIVRSFNRPINHKSHIILTPFTISKPPTNNLTFPTTTTIPTPFIFPPTPITNLSPPKHSRLFLLILYKLSCFDTKQYVSKCLHECAEYHQPEGLIIAEKGGATLWEIMDGCSYGGICKFRAISSPGGDAVWEAETMPCRSP